jgi:hypothetical protein
VIASITPQTGVRRTGAKQRFPQVLILLVTTISAVACSTKTLTDGPVHLPGGEWTVVASGEFAAHGELNEACVELPSVYGYSTELRRILRADSVELQLGARFWGDSGLLVSFDNPNAYVTGGQEAQLCFSERASHRQPYRRIEFHSSDTVSLGRITWWSGTPKKLL